jgi:hypothetical protein
MDAALQNIYLAAIFLVAFAVYGHIIGKLWKSYHGAFSWDCHQQALALLHVESASVAYLIACVLQIGLGCLGLVDLGQSPEPSLAAALLPLFIALPGAFYSVVMWKTARQLRFDLPFENHTDSENQLN